MKQTIEVDVPNGYEISKIEYFSDSQYIKVRIKEKMQPRRIRIVLEKTDEDNQKNAVKNIWCTQFFSHNLVVVDQPKIWREVKETDIPLTTDEPKLSLSKKDMIELIEHIKLGGQLNSRIANFIECNEWAEDLIVQLDDSHDGRNSWLAHYGRSKQAEEARKKSIFRFLEVNGRYNISKRKDD